MDLSRFRFRLCPWHALSRADVGVRFVGALQRGRGDRITTRVYYGRVGACLADLVVVQ
jgi:hypothetical protein